MRKVPAESVVALDTFVPPQSAGYPDIVVVSVDGYRYNLHKQVLTCGSDLFSDIFAMKNRETTSNHQDEEIALCDGVLERSEVLDLYFPFMYNIPSPKLDGLPVKLLLELFNISHKFRTVRAISASLFALSARHATCNNEEAFHIFVMAEQFNDKELAALVKVKAAEFFCGDCKTPGNYLLNLTSDGMNDLILSWRQRQLIRISEVESGKRQLQLDLQATSKALNELKEAANAFLRRVPSTTSAQGLQKKWTRLAALASK